MSPDVVDTRFSALSRQQDTCVAGRDRTWARLGSNEDDVTCATRRPPARDHGATRELPHRVDVLAWPISAGPRIVARSARWFGRGFVMVGLVPSTWTQLCRSLVPER